MKVRKSNFVWSSLGLAMVLSFLLSFSVQAQDCGCNHVIEVGTSHIDGSSMGIKPGDVVCLKAGKRDNLYIKNLKGSANSYITIKNCGGQVVLGGTNVNNGILVQNSRYFRITGTGDASYEYGIKVDKTKAGSQGIAVTEFSSDVEIDHVEINGAGFAGIMAKTDPKCDGSADRGKFTMYNINIHDNYIHDVGGEGLYIGNSFYGGTSVYCNRTQYPHEIKGVKVYNNIIKKTGWDAIQVGSATSDVEVHDNEIFNYATDNRDMHKSAIQLGLGTSGKCYNNFIENGSGEGIVIQGIGNNLVYNNVIIGAGLPAFNVNVRPTPLSSDIVSKGFLGGVYIINNTVIDSKNKGAINEYVNDASNNVFYNNLVVTGNSSWNQLKTYTDWNVDKNTIVSSVANAKFANAAADDYHLTEGSPAIDAGKDISSYGISKDWDGQSRKGGSATDAGAFEFKGTSAPSNEAPTVKAGADQTITLPTATASFTASAADSDGNISSYSWAKVSGPAASLSGTSTQTLKADKLLEGSYTFKVTVKDNDGATSSDQVSLTVQPAPAEEEETPTDNADSDDDKKESDSNTAPTANAGADQSIQLPVNSASFKGTASDSDGSITSYLWSKISGPDAMMNGGNTSTLSVEDLHEGTYTFRFRATDNSGNSTSDDVQLIVKAAATDNDDHTSGDEQPEEDTNNNAAPSANAGADQTVQLPTNVVKLTGTASDSDGSITSYLWSKISGPDAMMNGGNTSTLSVEDLREGTYTFRFRATDNSGNSTSDDVQLIVKAATGGESTDGGSNDEEDQSDDSGNNAPVAKAGADKTVQLPIDIIKLEASASDSDGSIASYLWSKISGPDAMMNGGNTSTLSVEDLREGTYTFRFRATDNSGNSTSDDINVTVVAASNDGESSDNTDGDQEEDQPENTEGTNPVVNAGGDKTIQLPLDFLLLEGSATDNGSIASYLWAKISGPDVMMNGGNTSTLNLSLLTPGTYTFRFRATDNEGNSSSDDINVVVKAAIAKGGEEEAPANLVPLVKASDDKTISLPTNSEQLTVAAKDEDGFITAYQWTKQSGPAANMSGTTTANLNLSNLIEGTYVFRITATDNQQASAYDEVKLTVVKEATANVAPKVSAGSDQVITLPTNYLALTATASDKDGSINSYQWSKQSGPAASLSGASSSRLNLSNLVEGTYIFRVTVQDNASATAYDEVMVKVAPQSTTTKTATIYQPIYRINAGGEDVSASSIQWENDTRENPSQFLSASSSNNSAGGWNWRGTNNTDAPDDIFGPIRFDFNWGGAVEYAFPVKDGSYEVRLYFAETPYAGGVAAAGERVFDIKLEGQTKVSGLDIYKEAGMNALQKTVEVSVKDGTLNLDFVRRIGNPQINGIEIIPTSSATNARTATFGAEEESAQPELAYTVYPNPVQDQLNVNFGKEITTAAQVQLISMNGTVLLEEELQDVIGSSKASLNVSQLDMPAGIYLLKVQADGGEAQVIKVMKQ